MYVLDKDDAIVVEVAVVDVLAIVVVVITADVVVVGTGLGA